jgi:site-specific DNA recombinase
MIERKEFEPRLRQARERLSALEQEATAAAERETQRQQLEEVLGQFRFFAEQVRANLEKADQPTRIRIVRLLVKQVEVDQEEVRIVYKVGQPPFEGGPAMGHLQDRSRRDGVTL